MSERVPLTPGQHIVLAGNPGVGKSSILNCTMGRVKFHAGIALGSGLTDALDTQHDEAADVYFSDTPGLEDITLREKAAQEISTVLQGGGKLKLVFVITLEAGRLKPADKATIETVLEAIKNIGVDPNDRYSVIVNKCEPGVLHLLQTRPDQRARLEYSLGVGRTFEHIGYMPLLPSAVGKFDHILGDNLHYIRFFNDAPELELQRGNNAKVESEGYDDRIIKMERELTLMRRDLELALNALEGNKRVKNFFSRIGRGITGPLKELMKERKFTKLV